MESDVTWGIVKHLKKSKFEKTDVIYRDKSLSETIYFIYKGNVKLYAENDFPFYEFGSQQTFGDSDMICNIRRIGSAIAFNDCMLYYVHKSQFEMVMQDFPHIRKKLLMKAIKDNRYLCQARYKVLTKNPLYGLRQKQKKALNNIKDIHKQLNEISKGFIVNKVN